MQADGSRSGMVDNPKTATLPQKQKTHLGEDPGGFSHIELYPVPLIAEAGAPNSVAGSLAREPLYPPVAGCLIE